MQIQLETPLQVDENLITSNLKTPLFRSLDLHGIFVRFVIQGKLSNYY